MRKEGSLVLISPREEEEIAEARDAGRDRAHSADPTCLCITQPPKHAVLGELAPGAGFEPAANRLTAGRSTAELSGSARQTPRRRGSQQV